MLLTIRVKPAPHLRAAFAKWAVAQTPKVDTCSHSEFCVPPDLFTLVPEELLIGATVDGHRYRSPLEDEQLAAGPQEREPVPGQPPPGGQVVAGDAQDDSGRAGAAAPAKTRARRTPAAAGGRRKAKPEDGR
ncbi:hypothetical protein ACFOOM_00885 [Streptomyces echinoruber]|uniref:Uncharacterized protein n=1 Tax=Streptomyces echinoruber TaxID=68898 RepID=A0A918QYP4_9ACTN|nr:hypothetical protein [Streptomyces echinoruber]GGZ73286.1 hypothetical protein GCM10010389_08570 [Streptomyces echinoruber]